jgi:aminoglycoside phosphotransferase family enzyme/predicted kinase
MSAGLGADLDLRLIETHTAVVLFMGDRVLKVKKAVDLGFLDHTTREARQRACEEEVRLNRRLSPDVYLGVADVVGPDGDLCDHMVVMRRMPADRCLTRCVVDGEDVDDALRAIAHLIAALHEHGRVDDEDAELASGASLAAMWRASFAELRASGVDTDASRRIEDLVERYLAGRGPLFAARIADGRVRDGHGDLMADDIYLLPDGPRILDCLEFDRRFRIADVIDDVAFLAMDLERLGRPDLARRFLTLYQEMSGATWPASLAHHHIAYRAHVRAKVAALRGAQVLAGGHASTHDLLAIARRHLEQAQVRLVLVGGLPGTGKSTVADAVAERLDAIVLRTDEVRLRVPAGVGPDRYRPENVRAVYGAAIAEAETLLGLGHDVVLDATWGAADVRAEARAVAERTSSEVVELRCTAPAGVAAHRIEARGPAGASASEATPAVAVALAERFVPWPEATVLDTTRPLRRSVADALEALAWPANGPTVDA